MSINCIGIAMYSLQRFDFLSPSQIYIYIYKEHINLHNFWIFTIELETVVAKDNNGLYYARLAAASMIAVTM